MDHAFSYATLKQIPGLLGHNRTAEIIALPLGAPVVLEELELRTGFDSLRNYPLPQASADIDHGADNSRVSRVRRDFLHERLMEFQRVRRKTSQIGKAGITRAKVVDCKPHPHGFQLTQGHHSSLRVMHQYALGQFQL